MPVSYRCWAEVDLTALRGNLAWIRHRVGRPVKIMTVVKADAYGHGLKHIAALLMQSGTDLFGVANLAEAEAIHSVGKGWPILMLGACLPEEVDAAVRANVMPTISCLEEAERFSNAGAKRHRTVALHVKVDTGMGRLGTAPEQAMDLFEGIATLPHLRCEGIFTHYSSAESDRAFSRVQAKRFEGVIRGLRARNLCPPCIHASNSAAVLCERRTIYNLVRPGLLVFGIVPPGLQRHERSLRRHLRPALSWKCRVGFLKEIHRGTPLSYGRSFIAPRTMRIATLTAGYGDGYLRAGSNQAQVLIGGRRCPVVGRITMDQMLVDVSTVPRVRVGDEAVLLGRQEREEITAVELAHWCDTVPWETLTAITYRVPRIYRGSYAA